MEAPDLTARVYRALVRRQARRHGYTVRGLEHLPDRGPALVVGYHGRVMALDMVLLHGRLMDAGREAWGLAHRGAHLTPRASKVATSLGLLDPSPERIAEVVSRDALILVTPGGPPEGLRPSPKYKVHWVLSKGYLRLALRHGLPIVPVGATGVDDTWSVHWSRHVKLGGPFGTVAIGSGRGRWPGVPFGPPNLVRIHQRIGEPVVLPPGSPDDTGWLDAAHEVVAAAVQAQLDAAQRDLVGGAAPESGRTAWPWKRDAPLR